MKKLIFTFAFVVAAFFIKAQDFNSAIGARLGTPFAASYKTFISQESALEGVAGFWSGYYSRYIQLAVLYQKHNALGDVSNLQWYYGFGGGVNFWSDGIDRRTYANNGVSVVVYGDIGLSYTFENIPLNLSLDWVPGLAIKISGNPLYSDYYGSGFGAGLFGLAARYVLN